MKNRLILITLSLTLLLTACEEIALYEKREVISGGAWSRQEPLRGEIEITDTASLYNLYVCIRHTDGYKYNNIWIRLKLANGNDTIHNLLLDIPLGSDALGWDGTGMNDIWDMRKKVNGPFLFKKAGLYHYEISQCMRESSLMGILSAGIRLEKQK